MLLLRVLESVRPFRNLNMYFRIRYFSDMQSNSYPTWNFSLLEYSGKKTIPLIKSLRCFLEHLNFKFISANDTKKSYSM